MSHIMVWRGRGREDGLGGFWHHGILCSDGSVIHYTGMYGVKTLRNASVLRTSMTGFDGGTDNLIHHVSYNEREHLHVFPPEEVQRRAESRIGQRSYHLLFDNCESFARWCVVGNEVSFQGRGVLAGAIAGFGSIVLGGGLLGAGITAVVVQRFWDARGNRSAGRQLFGNANDSDSDDE